MGATGLAYASLVEYRWYALRHVTVPVLRGPAVRPLRMLHVSDLHFAPGQEHRLTFMRDCLRVGPDLVVTTGDLLGHPDAVAPVVDALGALARDRLTLAILGANDYWGPKPKNPLHYLTRPQRRVTGKRLDTRRLVEGLTAAGVVVLDNERRSLTTPAGPVDVAALGDPHLRMDHPERVDWRTGAPKAALRLGLVHAPYQRSLQRFDEAGYDLVLAGHTHGGQLRLPGVGALTANCDLPLRHARGLSRYGADLWLHVSAGLGTSRYSPVRFACRPEATVLDLVHARRD